MNTHIDRRTFLSTSAGAVLAFTSSAQAGEKGKGTVKRSIKLGIDNFSIRAFGWKASRLIEYAASLRLDILLLSDLDVYESFEKDYLLGLKKQADQAGLEIHAGTGGICPTSSRAITKYGSSEDHLALTIRVAKTLGSPIARCLPWINGGPPG